MKSIAVLLIIVSATLMIYFVARLVLSMPLPQFMVKQMREDAIHQQETGSALSSVDRRLVFSKHGNIYCINLGGSNLKQLTSNDLSERDPCFSPDGQMICYTRQMDVPHSDEEIPYDYNGIAVMNANGMDQHVVFPAKASVLNSDPSFSSDGKKIVFTRHLCDPRLQPNSNSTLEINCDGSSLQEYNWLSKPQYSADGKTIYGLNPDDHVHIYSPTGPSKAEIWAIDRKTKKKHVISRIPIGACNLKYSPDFKQVVFIALDSNNQSVGSRQFQVYIADIDGSNIKKLTQDVGTKNNPTFTSDGSEVIFLQDSMGKRFIKLINLDGSNVRTICQW